MRTLTPLCVAAVFVHPALADVVSIRPNHDNTMYAESDGLSNALGPDVFLGKQSGGWARRALLSFDVGAAVPAGSTISAVTLTMRCTRGHGSSIAVEMHRVMSSWGEATSLSTGAGGGGGLATTGDATWGDRFYDMGMPWTNPGGDFAAGASSVVTVGSAGAFYTWPSTAALVADVQSMLGASAANYGWILIGNETTPGNAKRLASRENPTTSYRPTLTITYTAVPAPGGAAVLALAGLAFGRRRR